MIISRGRRYIFVHIPKTGGTAMALALEGRSMKDDIMLGDTPKARNRRRRMRDVKTAGRLWKHSTLADIDGVVDRKEVADLFTFTLIRNPWDRMVSYYHWLREQNFAHPAVAIAQAHDFTEFLHHADIEASFRAHPYSAYMRDAGGKESANLYIRLENFSEDAEPLWQHLGFRLGLDRVNESTRTRDFRKYYNDQDANHLADLCAGDIARFGYSFE